MAVTDILSNMFSSWAEIHAALMGIGLGLLAAAANHKLPAREWLLLIGFIAGLLVGLNLNVSPWEGWWHTWYILGPFAVIVYVVARSKKRNKSSPQSSCFFR